MKYYMNSLPTYWNLEGEENSFPNGVFTKSNEKGAYGIGADLIKIFNEDFVIGVKVK